MPSVKPPYETFAKIKVIGVGGSGGKAVTHMAKAQIRGVELVAVNTDAQDLHHVNVPSKVHIGKLATRGLGAGMNPDLGRQAAEESREEIRELIKDTDMVFITGGLGGGTCSGAASVIAEIAKEAGALTVAVITKPFAFEGRQRTRIASDAWESLRRHVDAIVTIENDRVLDLIDKQTTLLQAFKEVNEVLRQAVAGIAEIITVPGLINVDFADVRSIMADAGLAHMSIGKASGEHRMAEAAKTAIASPLVDTTMDGAQGILFSVVGGPDITMQEVHEAAKLITDRAHEDARIIFGAVIDRSLPKRTVRITLVATGFGAKETSTASAVATVASVQQPGPRALRTVGTAASMPPATPVASVTNGEMNSDLDDDPFQMPAFIRKKMKEGDK